MTGNDDILEHALRFLGQDRLKIMIKLTTYIILENSPRISLKQQ